MLSQVIDDVVVGVWSGVVHLAESSDESWYQLVLDIVACRGVGKVEIESDPVDELVLRRFLNFIGCHVVHHIVDASEIGCGPLS